MSSSSKIRYHRLSQSEVENEDEAEEEDDDDEGFEENIIFDYRLANTPTQIERGDAFELEKLGQPRFSCRSSRSNHCQTRRCLVFSIGLLMLLVTVMIGLLVWLINPHLSVVHHISASFNATNTSATDWNVKVDNVLSESNIESLTSADGNGHKDILVGLSNTSQCGTDTPHSLSSCQLGAES